MKTEIINAQNHNLGERLNEEVYKPSLSMAFTQFKVKVDDDGTKYTKKVNVITYSTAYTYIPPERIQSAIENAEVPTSEVKLIKHLPINNKTMGSSSGRKFLKDHIDSLAGDKHGLIENYVMSSDVVQKTMKYKKVGYDVDFKDILSDIYWKYNNSQHENHASLDYVIESLSELTPEDRKYVISKFIK